ncbi:MAG: BatA and WFA domain-containing protein [Clostridia bacterium]|nr:BatA and WFA domain-containing protein [Clostridia bacterium]
MHFLFPAGAWGFLSLGVITALYLLKRRSQTVQVPSLLLWQRALAEQQAMKPFQKLKKNILYFLQMAMAVLLTLALMRPAISGGVRGETVMIFDLSASMQAEDRLEQAKERAMNLIDGMGAGDRVTVLTAAREAEIALSRSEDLSRVRSVINGLAARNGGADLDAALSLAQAMGRDMEGLNILVFSDSFTSDAAQVIRVGTPQGNRALLSLSVQNGQAFVRVANYGEAATVTLECEADGALCDAVTVALDADEAGSALLSVPADAQTVRVRIQEADALLTDNERWFAAREDGTYRAALCGDNVFLEKALSLREDLTLLRTTKEEAASLENIDLYIFDGALPETLPDQGALLCVAPDREVLDIRIGEKTDRVSAVRPGFSRQAQALTAHLLLEDIALRAYTPLDGGEAILRSGNDALIAVTEKADRRAAVVGFDLHDSNLPMKGDFPILTQNLLGYLLPDARQAFPDGVCGDSLSLPADARLIAPDGRPAADTWEQGIYTVHYRIADGAERTARFTLHMDPAESDLQQVVGGTDEINLITRADAGRELTPWVLLAFLALALVEWEVSRRVA